MTARMELVPEEQMTIEEFLAFTDTRPQEERWELIEGVAVRNPRPTQLHQLVTASVGAYLMSHKNQIRATRSGRVGCHYSALVSACPCLRTAFQRPTSS